ncbi:MAG: ABC transporter permease [Eubacteriales bacterium]|nr:ABC transporter permease [Eubacteriales bacterium]
MKGSKTLGMLVAILAVVVLVAGIVGSGLDTNTGALGQKMIAAQELYDEISAHQRAAEKTAPSAVKKADTALKSAQTAVEKAQEAYAEMQALHEGLTNDMLSGDETLDALLAAAAKAGESLTEENAGVQDMQALTQDMALQLYADIAQDAHKALTGAQEKIATAQEGIGDVLVAIGAQSEGVTVGASELAAHATGEEYLSCMQEIIAAAEALLPMAEQTVADADAVLEQAQKVVAADSMDVQSRFIVFLELNWIGFIFTAVLLFVVALVLMFWAKQFAETWRKAPVFSTGMAALVMIAIMTYALGFHFESVGEWASYWFNNAMNVLRANSSVGMIALGMTFVIISGGIDLAVGSTRAGVSTVIMCLIDVGQNGVLANMGITGLPAYIIACVAGVATGVALGGITGGVITKGKVPPFIVTLGMMQIIRSVAQYFTKSYNPDVPKAFQSLANQVIGGQMLLPILYWLVLAVVLYVVSKHTAFGRHVYAVGSNERTTMLSGINVNKVKMKVYVLMGFIVALASIVQVARLRGVDVASAGNGYEMNAIAAVVVGGTSMAGGKGSIIGTVLGVLIIGIMNNLLVLLSVDSFLSSAFTGAIVIAAVLMQRKEKAA